MNKKVKCSMCGYYLPKKLFSNPYSKGFYNICNKCVEKQIHIFFGEIKRKKAVSKNGSSNSGTFE